jgi:DNA helicase-2/ATP-dependent DNA helicase PcrA
MEEVMYSQRGDDYSVVIAAYSLAANRMCSIEEAIASMEPNPLLTATKRENFMKKWNSYKKHEGKIDFLDMLTTYNNGDFEPLPCSVVFIDEAQDLSELQWSIVRKMTKDAERIYIAGDDDQAIYGFIGGSEFGFYRYPANEEIVLEQSYRVPRAIGEHATSVIKTLKERKEKNVKWLDKPGAVEWFSRGEFETDWNGWKRANKSVMVLNRHRKGQNSVSKALRDFGVSHLSAGESVVDTDEGKAFCTVVRLKDGQFVRPREVADLFKMTGDKKEEKRMRSLGAKDRKLLIGVKDVKLNLMGRWHDQFTLDNKHAKRIFDDLDRILQREGTQSILDVPNIHVSTMHASKGKEADIVIISPDCNEVVKKNLYLPAEVRLAYVALTRAKEKVIVYPNRSGQEITHYRRK